MKGMRMKGSVGVERISLPQNESVAEESTDGVGGRRKVSIDLRQAKKAICSDLARRTRGKREWEALEMGRTAEKPANSYKKKRSS